MSKAEAHLFYGIRATVRVILMQGPDNSNLTFQQFLEAASYLSHPFDECRHVPDHLTRSFFQLLVRGPSDVAAFRAKTLWRWTEQAEKLADAEKEVPSRMPDSVLRVMQGKGLLLLREISREIGWPDTGLFDELCQGFRITGVGTQSNVFKPGVRVGPLSVSVGADDRGQIANFLRPPILGKLRRSKEDALCEQLREITEAEAAQKDWLEGP